MRHVIGFSALLLVLMSAGPLHAQLSQKWVAIYNGPTNEVDEPAAVTVDSAGNVFVTGASWNGDNHDIVTIKYSGATGSLLWSNRYNGPASGNDYGHDLATDSSGNLFITGYSYNGTNEDCYTAKYAGSNGALLWSKQFNGTGNGSDRAQALLCDSAGNPIIAGYSHNGTDYDILLLKYTNTTGSLLWSNRYDGPGHGDEVATAIARDGSNSVVVTGYSAAGGGTNDLFTAKFAPATGSLLWERRYHGTGGTCHFGNAVACDTAGNVAVAGSSSNGTNLDWYVAKYAAASGTLVWEDRHKGTGNRDDGANAVAFDSAGNVVATGYDYNTGSNNDLFAVKYDGATGAVLWSNRYDGAASIDIGTSAVVDASNGVFVAGHSRGPDGNPDLYLLKYASATGAVLWQQRFTVSTNSYEETPGMRALTLTPDSGIAVAARTITNRSDYLTIKFAP